MVSPVVAKKLSANLAELLRDFDPDTTNPTSLAKVDMRDFGTFKAQFMRTIGTSAFQFAIVANTDTTTTGQVEVVSATYTAGEPNAVGDNVFLEIDVDMLNSLGTDLRYVGARGAFATGTDEGVISYLRGNPRRAYDGLTADVIA